MAEAANRALGSVSNGVHCNLLLAVDLTHLAGDVTGLDVTSSVRWPASLGGGPITSCPHAPVAQLAEATVSNTVKCRFESDPGHAKQRQLWS